MLVSGVLLTQLGKAKAVVSAVVFGWDICEVICVI